VIRRLVRLGAVAAVTLLFLAALVLSVFRARAFLRETEERHAPPRSGRFVATPMGEVRCQERGAPEGRPVVFVGGTMASSDTFLPLLDALCDARLRCLAIDLPPFGYSEPPPDGDYSRARQAARIDAFLRELRLRDTLLVGHSFGGGPVVETAMRYPDDVRTFALLAGALGLRAEPPSGIVRAALSVAPLRTSLAAATVNPWAVRQSLRHFIADDAIVTDELVERYAAPGRLRGTARASGRWAQTALFGDESASLSGQRGSYRRYRPSVLLVWGDRDVATPLAQAEDLKTLLPNARLDVLRGVGHFPHVEARAAVVEALRPFLLAEGETGR
jgi:pimeloyl-ACP methyl ester carboxylesterase